MMTMINHKNNWKKLKFENKKYLMLVTVCTWLKFTCPDE